MPAVEDSPQDHEMHHVPRCGERVEMSLPDGTPVSFQVVQVHTILHAVIPADVVVELEYAE